MDTSERNCEEAIEEGLVSNYRRRKPEDYDRTRCLDQGAPFDFIYATQPEEWERLKKQHGAEVKERFLAPLTKEVAKRGTLEVLRQGIKDSGCTFQLAYFQPVSGLNEALQKLYEANQFTIIRQLQYKEKTQHSLDMALFLNGLPIFTVVVQKPTKGEGGK